MQSKLDAIKATFPVMHPRQLALALEALAFTCAELFMELHPLSPGVTQAERDRVRVDMMAIAMSEALNAAAMAMAGVHPAQPKQPGAAPAEQPEREPTPEEVDAANAAALEAISKARNLH